MQIISTGVDVIKRSERCRTTINSLAILQIAGAN